MGELPGDLRYTNEHEWLRQEEDGTVTIGITDHAQGALGDLVYVELPEVGQDVDAGGEFVVRDPHDQGGAEEVVPDRVDPALLTGALGERDDGELGTERPEDLALEVEFGKEVDLHLAVLHRSAKPRKYSPTNNAKR